MVDGGKQPTYNKPIVRWCTYGGGSSTMSIIIGMRFDRPASWNNLDPNSCGVRRMRAKWLQHVMVNDYNCNTLTIDQ